MFRALILFTFLSLFVRGAPWSSLILWLNGHLGASSSPVVSEKLQLHPTGWTLILHTWPGWDKGEPDTPCEVTATLDQGSGNVPWTLLQQKRHQTRVFLLTFCDLSATRALCASTAHLELTILS